MYILYIISESDDIVLTTSEKFNSESDFIQNLANIIDTGIDLIDLQAQANEIAKKQGYIFKDETL